MQAQTQYLEAVEKFGRLKEETDALLAERDDAYLELLAVPSPRTGAGTRLARSSLSAAEDGGHLQPDNGAAQSKGLFAGLFGGKR
jgi:hypothetical protein